MKQLRFKQKIKIYERLIAAQIRKLEMQRAEFEL